MNSYVKENYPMLEGETVSEIIIQNSYYGKYGNGEAKEVIQKLTNEFFKLWWLIDQITQGEDLDKLTKEAYEK